MATSGTTTFESGFYIDDVITEAYERIGRFDYSGNDIKTARRSLNIMFQEWGNRGLHFWEVKNNSITLVDGQSEYTMYRSTADGTSDATPHWAALECIVVEEVGTSATAAPHWAALYGVDEKDPDAFVQHL